LSDLGLRRPWMRQREQEMARHHTNLRREPNRRRRRKERARDAPILSLLPTKTQQKIKC